jgi:hypothetical protein
MINRFNIHRTRAFPAVIFTLLLVVSALASPALMGQDESEKAPKPTKLFKSSETMKVKLIAPWRDLLRDTNDGGAFPATIEYTDELGNSESLPLTVERRGLTRQRVCDFPPIRLRFKKQDAKGTTFRGQKSIKMVTHCEKSTKYEQYYVLEMLAYQIYNQITDFSFRVRPLDVDYVDSERDSTISGKFAFLIEDDSDVADRHDMKKIKIGRLKPSWLEPDVTSELTLFQYMIGNVDWAALSGPDPQECCHNAKLIAVEPIQKNGDIYPIPYDFDSAGFVDAPYAAPPQGLPIRRVTQRLYRGYCVSNPYMEDARKRILDQERAIMALVKEEPRLNSKTRSEAEGYLADFFEIIKDNRDWNKNIIEKCRK